MNPRSRQRPRQRTAAPGLQVEVVVAPSLLTEGKVYQKAQQLGMGK